MTTVTVGDYMTAGPHTIGDEQPLVHAHAMLKEHGVRHLPVLRGGHLVGMITERDLALIETLADVEPCEVRVEEAMQAQVFTVGPREPLEQVARAMAERRIGSAVVMDDGKVVGVFTTVDALNALAEVLEAQGAPARRRQAKGHVHRLG